MNIVKNETWHIIHAPNFGVAQKVLEPTELFKHFWKLKRPINMSLGHFIFS